MRAGLDEDRRRARPTCGRLIARAGKGN
jgi:hypothetical protein